VKTFRARAGSVQLTIEERSRIPLRVCNGKVIMVVPGTLRSVDLDFDSTNPARGEVVNERTDHGSDATDDPIHDGAHDHGRQANGTRKRHVRMRNKRGSGQRDQAVMTSI